MSAKKKTWQEKLADDKGLPQVGKIEGRMSKKWGEGTFVVPAPREVDAIMRGVKKGKLITIDGIREKLAQKHGTTMACPLTTGIFAWIAAHAAEEARGKGKQNVTPYWRTVKAKGELNPKYPGGIPNLRKLLEDEGHRVTQKGKRYFVSGLVGAAPPTARPSRV